MVPSGAGHTLPLNALFVSTITRTSFTSTPEQDVMYCLICFCSALTVMGMFTPLASEMRMAMITPSRAWWMRVEVTFSSSCVSTHFLTMFSIADREMLRSPYSVCCMMKPRSRLERNSIAKPLSPSRHSATATATMATRCHRL